MTKYYYCYTNMHASTVLQVYLTMYGTVYLRLAIVNTTVLLTVFAHLLRN